MEDIIIRNGLIVDVENEKIAKGDISVKDGKIVGKGHNCVVSKKRPN